MIGIISNKQEKVASTGSPYITFNLSISPTEKRFVKDWECHSKPYNNGDGVDCGLKEDTWEGKIQYVLVSIKKEDIDPKDFMEKLDEELLKERRVQFGKFISEFSSPVLKKIVLKIFSKRIKSAFIECPASFYYHEALIGGLINHTVCVTKDAKERAEKLKETYPDLDIDIDVIVAGGLLHDIGKIEDYELGRGIIEKTTSLRLFYHLNIGFGVVFREVSHVWKDIEEDDKKRCLKLLHVVLSHHGRAEFLGVDPAIPEAVILSQADTFNFLATTKDDGRKLVTEFNFKHLLEEDS